MSFDESQLRVVELLQMRPQLDLFQIASATRMAPDVAQRALETLQGHGIVHASNQRSSTWYSLDGQALHDTLSQPTAVV